MSEYRGDTAPARATNTPISTANTPRFVRFDTSHEVQSTLPLASHHRATRRVGLDAKHRATTLQPRPFANSTRFLRTPERSDNASIRHAVAQIYRCYVHCRPIGLVRLFSTGQTICRGRRYRSRSLSRTLARHVGVPSRISRTDEPVSKRCFRASGSNPFPTTGQRQWTRQSRGLNLHITCRVVLCSPLVMDHSSLAKIGGNYRREDYN